MFKRILDVVVSLTALVVFCPFGLIVAVLIRMDSKGPVFYTQERIGLNFKPFRLLKFRSMVEENGKSGFALSVSEGRRITKIGKILRKTKIDEFPQLINVVKGDMSVVGTRPEVPVYVNLYHNDFTELLSMKPGITDPGSIVYRHEDKLLSDSKDPETHYVKEILPRKIKLGKEYVRNFSLFSDLKILVKTFGVLLG